MELTTFYKNLVSLCAKNKLSVSGAAKAIGLSNAAANGWKKGKMPNDTSREKLANLLHVSVGELMGDAIPEQKESAPDPKTEGVKKARATEGEGYTDLQKAAIQFVLSLPPEKLERFIKMGRAAFEEEQ